mmetsp:Transcript_13433/g.31627  ORF Transcript_13433/g.31627 Transcript_13433/m.31627 type:complete len:426 (+) Transcript_13433:145-1422(+)
MRGNDINSAELKIIVDRDHTSSDKSRDRPILLDMLHFIIRTLPVCCILLLRLLLFVICLLPGFIRFAWYYFIASDRISLHYRNESVRQRVDVYRLPNHTKRQRQGALRSERFLTVDDYSSSNAPVVVFCTGGGWVIGYKMWGALLARALTAAGVVVVIPDTRNYPMVSIPHMVDDIDSAIGWTRKNIAKHGGDPRNIVIVGQSAGGHLACMAIFRKIRRKIARENGNVAEDGLPRGATSLEKKKEERLDEGWLVSDIRGFAVISSPLSLGSAMTKSFRRKGFDDNTVQRMFAFKKDQYDPHFALNSFRTLEEKKKFVQELPPISIYQGTEDKTVPFEVAETFYRELIKAKPDKESVFFVPYVGWSHTDPILEGPMDADHRLHKDLFNDVNRWATSPNLSWPNNSRVNARLCPHFLVTLSRWLNPF